MPLPDGQLFIADDKRTFSHNASSLNLLLTDIKLSIIKVALEISFLWYGLNKGRGFHSGLPIYYLQIFYNCHGDFFSFPGIIGKPKMIYTQAWQNLQSLLTVEKTPIIP